MRARGDVGSTRPKLDPRAFSLKQSSIGISSARHGVRAVHFGGRDTASRRARFATFYNGADVS